MITKQFRDRLRKKDSDVKWCALFLLCFCFIFACIVYHDAPDVKVWDGSRYMSPSEVDDYIVRLENEVTRRGGDTAEIATQR
jgi:hypothetical protein